MNQPIPLWQALASVFGVIIVGLIGHFIALRKYQTDLAQKNYENSMKIVETHDAAYRAYVTALATYLENPTPTSDDFTAMVTAGDVYFNQANSMCVCMLSGKVDPNIRDDLWIPKVRRVYEKTLPDHYDTLKSEAKKRGYPYRGELRRRDHESIYRAAERFGTTDAWRRPHEED